MTHPRSPRSGVTLIEMVVVIGVIVLLIGMPMSALTILRKKSDYFNDAQVIRMVHDLQRANAMQLGHTGKIYGYTIRKDLAGIQPWVDTPTNLMSSQDIGRSLSWTGSPAYIGFIGSHAPVRDNLAAGVSPTNLSQDIHVAFVPRAGFAVATVDGSTPTATLAACTPQGVAFRLRTRGTGFRDEQRIVITPVGTMSNHAP